MKVLKDSFGTVLEQLNGAVDTMEITDIGWRIHRRYMAYDPRGRIQL
jgi:hypothetical protein